MTGNQLPPSASCSKEREKEGDAGSNKGGRGGKTERTGRFFSQPKGREKKRMGQFVGERLQKEERGENEKDVGSHTIPPIETQEEGENGT